MTEDELRELIESEEKRMSNVHKVLTFEKVAPELYTVILTSGGHACELGRNIVLRDGDMLSIRLNYASDIDSTQYTEVAYLIDDRSAGINSSKMEKSKKLLRAIEFD